MVQFTVLDDEAHVEQGLAGQARFTVIGVGGGGGNAVEHMVRSNTMGVNFVVANTDRQALELMTAPLKIQLGVKSTRGLGAGANPEVGKISAEEEAEQLREVLKNTDMVFITAGMGGGTGTGAAPVVARMAREMGILSVGVVTKPFNFEGKKRARVAEEGIRQLFDHVDSLIIIPNEKILANYPNMPTKEAFRRVDDVLHNAVRSMFDLVINPGTINIDFADVKTAMQSRGFAMMGMGIASGDNRAIEAAEKAIHSPLLDNVQLKNAQGLLINITASDDVTPQEFQTVMDVVNQIADEEEADIFFGTVIDPEAGDQLRVTVIATGLERGPEPPAMPRMSTQPAYPQQQGLPAGYPPSHGQQQTYPGAYPQASNPGYAPGMPQHPGHYPQGQQPPQPAPATPAPTGGMPAGMTTMQPATVGGQPSSQPPAPCPAEPVPEVKPAEPTGSMSIKDFLKNQQKK